jgi:hypothetical protein
MTIDIVNLLVPLPARADDHSYPSIMLGLAAKERQAAPPYSGDTAVTETIKNRGNSGNRVAKCDLAGASADNHNR